MSLKEGEQIKIFGWPMLAGLEDGKSYQVTKVKMKEHPFTKEMTPNIYEFTRIKANGTLGIKTIRHLAKDIDLWVKNDFDFGYNGIKVIGAAASKDVVAEQSGEELLFTADRQPPTTYALKA
jgi:hypothetical protein